MKFKIDTREPIKEKLQGYFKEFGVETEIDMLQVGDITCDERGMCIERKEVTDFYSSIKDGRLFEQARNMMLNYENNYIIVIGTYKKLFFKKTDVMHVNVNVFLGAMSSLASKYNIKVMTVDNTKQLAYLVSKLAEKQGQPVEMVSRLRMTDADVHINMIGCIPGVGYKKAASILKQVPFHEIIMDDGTKLKEVDGIGDILCQNVLKYLGFRDKLINVVGITSIAQQEVDNMRTMKISTGSGGEGSVRTVRILSKSDVKIKYSKGYPTCAEENHFPDCPTIPQIIEHFNTTGEIHPKCAICPLSGNIEKKKEGIKEYIEKSRGETMVKEEKIEKPEMDVELDKDDTVDATEELEEADKLGKKDRKKRKGKAISELLVPLKWRKRVSGKKVFRKPLVKVEMEKQVTKLFLQKEGKYVEVYKEEREMPDSEILQKLIELMKEHGVNDKEVQDSVEVEKEDTEEAS